MSLGKYLHLIYLVYTRDKKERALGADSTESGVKRVVYFTPIVQNLLLGFQTKPKQTLIDNYVANRVWLINLPSWNGPPSTLCGLNKQLLKWSTKINFK